MSEQFKKLVKKYGQMLGLLLIVLSPVIGGIAVAFWPSNTAVKPVSQVTVVKASNPADQSKIDAMRGQLDSIKAKEEEDQALGQYTINMMYKSPETIKVLSPGMMRVMTRNIVQDTRDVMGDDAIQKQFFIGAVQMESRFLKFSQSPTGPKGLSQTTRATFHAALRFCGVNEVKDEDVWDTDLSIYAGACYFKWLYMSYYNNPSQCPDNAKEPWTKKVCAGQMASVAYNQGPESKSAKSFAKNGLLDEMEPAVYQGKVIFNVTTTTDQPMPGVPAFKDLPKPAAKLKDVSVNLPNG